MSSLSLPPPVDLGHGALHFKRALSDTAQIELGETVWNAANEAGWIAPKTPGGKPFSVRQLNFGALGWISDSQGYRYTDTHPETRAHWPPIPAVAHRLWDALLPDSPPPEACLVNHYTDQAKMGLHRDADEAAGDVAILSISLGAPARFRLGGAGRADKTASIVLESGDVLVMAGASRHFYHGVDKLLPDDPLFRLPFPFEGRISLTLRRVTIPSDPSHTPA